MPLIYLIDVLYQTQQYYVSTIWVVSQVLLSQGFDKMRLSISYGFYMNDFLKDYLNVVKSFNSALLFICIYAMNDMKGLVEDLREVKYDGCTQECHIFQGVLSGCHNLGIIAQVMKVVLGIQKYHKVTFSRVFTICVNCNTSMDARLQDDRISLLF